MAAMAHVHVRDLAEGEGIAWDQGELAAFAGGVKVAGTDWESAEFTDADLVALFPALTFSHGAPHTGEYLISLNAQTASGRRVEGTIKVTDPDTGAERRYPWLAERVASPVFRDHRGAQGESAVAEHAIRGWAYRIPGQLTGDDPVLERRLGLAIIGILSDLGSGRDARLPVRKRISNVFSAASPAPSPELAPALDELVLASRR